MRQEMRRTSDWNIFIAMKKRRRIMTMAVLTVLLPLLLFLFYYLFQGRHYVVFGLLMLVCLMGALVVNFERRRPRAREIVLLATMTAFTVASNELCAHTVPLHAGTALVVLSGIGLGPEAGFFIGALGRFLCNFFDGHGPWTPWQMFAWGLIGYLAGLFFNRIERRSRLEKQTLASRLSLQKSQKCRAAGPVLCILASWLIGYVVFVLSGDNSESFFGWRIYVWGLAGMLVGGIFQRRRLPADTITVTVYTFFSSALLYGGIMNFAAMLMSAPPGSGVAVNLPVLRALYLTGLPYDLAHAGGAALCAFIFGDAILQRIERIRIKFGILL